MVHALKEAHRVVRPGGLLIDLRPAPAHRQLGLGQGRAWKFIGQLHEVLDDDYAANAAVAQLVRERLLHLDRRIRFQLDRVMDSVEDVREFLADFDQRRDLPPHTRLLEKLERLQSRAAATSKFTVRGPMQLAVYTRIDPIAD